MDGQVKVGVRNWLVITVMAILGIVLMKVIFTKYQVRGVSEVVQAA